MESQQNIEMQEIPANVYRSDERVTIAAPMPGLQPENITVQVSEGARVTLHGDLRGALKDEKEILSDEWTPGPYHREIELPADVDGQSANVTYSNGVLVVALPLADRTTAANLTLDEVSPTKGARTGNRGKGAASGRRGDTPRRGGSEGTTSYTTGETL